MAGWSDSSWIIPLASRRDIRHLDQVWKVLDTVMRRPEPGSSGYRVDIPISTHFDQAEVQVYNAILDEDNRLNVTWMAIYSIPYKIILEEVIPQEAILGEIVKQA